MNRFGVDSESDNNNNICVMNSAALVPKLHVDIIGLLQNEVNVGLWSEHSGWDVRSWKMKHSYTWWGMLTLESSRAVPSGKISSQIVSCQGSRRIAPKTSTRPWFHQVISTKKCRNVIFIDAETLLQYMQSILEKSIRFNQSHHDGSNELL